MEKRVHDNFPLFSRFLKSHNSHEFCNIWANLNCECTHMHILTVVNNCLIYCPGCILQNHLRSRPAWADCFYGPPNEIRVLFSSDAMPYLETHFSPESCEVSSFAAARSSCRWNCHRCGLQTRENSWSLSPLQRALAEQLPPSPQRQRQHRLLLLFHALSLFFQRHFFPLFHVLLLNLQEAAAGLEPC